VPADGTLARSSLASPALDRRRGDRFFSTLFFLFRRGLLVGELEESVVPSPALFPPGVVAFFLFLQGRVRDKGGEEDKEESVINPARLMTFRVARAFLAFRKI